MICPRRLLRRPSKYTVNWDRVYWNRLTNVFSARTVLAKNRVRTPKAAAGSLQGGSTGIRLPVGFSCGRQDCGGSSRRRATPIHRAQVLSYLKLGGWKLGLLINFHVPLLATALNAWYSVYEPLCVLCVSAVL